MSETAARGVRLYRCFLRAAHKLGDTNEKRYVLAKVKHEFRVPAGSSQEMEFAFDLASTQLENLQARTAHYDALMESHSFSPEALKAIKGVDTLAQKRKQ
mmetsp:Transcript_26407/g.66405  ORF Transcript_26407/g.66405 Transcript_26407/m.66405 type:complete len:100 (+) Transcript_26407:344-643(+)